MDFNIIYHAVGSVLTLSLIGAVGYFLARKGWFSPEAKALLPRLVIQVSLPAFLFHNISSSFDRDALFHLVYGALVPFASISICFGISILLAKLLKVSHRRRGIFQVGITASNTMFIGVPVNMALFGDQALPYVLLYYFANTSYFWTVGNYILAADGGKKEKIISKATLKQVFSPPMIAFLLSLCLLVLDFRLPGFIQNTVRYLGNLTTPLIIIFLGIMVQAIPFKNIHPDRDLMVILLGRFILSPLIVALLTLVFPLPELMRKVFIIQAALPTVASLSLMADYYRSDPEFATLVVSATTLLSLAVIPFYMVLLTY